MAILSATTIFSPVFADTHEDSVFEGQLIPARSVGPAAISGRVMSIESEPENADIIYVGGATSGVWKSLNGGTSWQPITDTLDTSSIGSITIDPNDSNIIWLGTGEPKPRYGTGFGNGVYKSVDAGQSWSHLGLSESERIQTILIDPENSDTAYVAVIGAAWNDSEDRGVYKTTDGGQTWRKVLYTNERSGAASLTMDPKNPNKLFAAMWDFRREPWTFTSGGAGSGLFVSEDGGESWTQLGPQHGLPTGQLGRIGISFAPSDSDRVYALIESEESGIYRSDDGGGSWNLMSNSSEQFTILSRPWYFQKLEVDPNNSDILYHLHGAVHQSVDGGASFAPIDIGKGVHADHHDLWIDPDNSSHLWLGTDGGVYESNDMGGSWRFISNLPMTQLYNVNLDMQQPYNIYTSIQDQANWRGPSMVPTYGGIGNDKWIPIAGRESGMVLPIPGDERYVYGLANMGPLYITDTITGMFDEITPIASDIDLALRRNNAVAIALNPFDANGLYYGSQFVHYTSDRGKTWKTMSPDLTTNDTEKQIYWASGGLTWENFGGVTHTTIVEIAPSTLDKDVVWVGTDDGNVQVTENGGQSWRSVAAQLQAYLTPGFWVADIKPSNRNRGEAWVVANDFRRGDRGSFLFHTKNFGQQWARIDTSTVKGPLHSFEQDPEAENLMFLGAESGLYVSFDLGKYWQKYTDGLPTVAVRGTAIHPRDRDLVIATYGRGAYIIDDISPLRQMAAEHELTQQGFYAFDIAPVRQYWRSIAPLVFKNGQPYIGQNPSYGAQLTFYAAESLAGDPIQISILNKDGTTLAVLSKEIKAGLNRPAWNLRPDKSATVASYYSGWPPVRYQMPEVIQGDYQAVFQAGGTSVTRSFTVLADPRLEATDEDRAQNALAVAWLVGAIDQLNTAYVQLQQTVGALESRTELLMDSSNTKTTLDAVQKAQLKLSDLANRIHFQFQQRQVSVEPVEETKRREWPGGVLDYISRRVWPQMSLAWNRLSPNDIRVLEHASNRMQVVANDINDAVASEGTILNEALDEAGIERVELPAPVSLQALPVSLYD